MKILNRNIANLCLLLLAIVIIYGTAFSSSSLYMLPPSNTTDSNDADPSGSKESDSEKKEGQQLEEFQCDVNMLNQEVSFFATNGSITTKPLQIIREITRSYAALTNANSGRKFIIFLGGAKEIAKLFMAQYGTILDILWDIFVGQTMPLDKTPVILNAIGCLRNDMMAQFKKIGRQIEKLEKNLKAFTLRNNYLNQVSLPLLSLQSWFVDMLNHNGNETEFKIGIEIFIQQAEKSRLDNLMKVIKGIISDTCFLTPEDEENGENSQCLMLSSFDEFDQKRDLFLNFMQHIQLDTAKVLLLASTYFGLNPNGNRTRGQYLENTCNTYIDICEHMFKWINHNLKKSWPKIFEKHVETIIEDTPIPNVFSGDAFSLTIQELATTIRTDIEQLGEEGYLYQVYIFSPSPFTYAGESFTVGRFFYIFHDNVTFVKYYSKNKKLMVLVFPLLMQTLDDSERNTMLSMQSRIFDVKNGLFTQIPETQEELYKRFKHFYLDGKGSGIDGDKWELARPKRIQAMIYVVSRWKCLKWKPFTSCPNVDTSEEPHIAMANASMDSTFPEYSLNNSLLAYQDAHFHFKRQQTNNFDTQCTNDHDHSLACFDNFVHVSFIF